MTKAITFAAFGVLLGACGGGSGPEGGAAYVVLDAEARSAGVAVEADGVSAPALPLEVDPDLDLALRVGGRRSRLALEPGTLAVVRGASAQIETMQVGVDVSEDRLLVSGTEESAKNLAALVAGQIGERDDGFWVITASDVFQRTSYLVPPEGFIEAMPQRKQSGDRPVATRGEDLPNAGPFDVRTPDAFDKPALVGLYRAGRSILVLDAGGGFTLNDDCEGSNGQRAGRYILHRGIVELATPEGDHIRLSLGASSLTDSAGVRFSPIVPPDDGPVADEEEGKSKSGGAQ